MYGNTINMQTVIQCVVLVGAINLVVAAKVAKEGYCWKDFNGDIPSDALPAGKDVNSQPIYIGQALHSTFLVPAEIYADGRVYFEMNGLSHNTSSNIKILCTEHPEQFEWVSTDNDNIKLLVDKNLVIGGVDHPGTTTYIGRLRAGGEILVGKVLDDIPAQYAGLHIARNGVGERHVSFQVLAYNPKPKTD